MTSHTTLPRLKVLEAAEKAIDSIHQKRHKLYEQELQHLMRPRFFGLLQRTRKEAQFLLAAQALPMHECVFGAQLKRLERLARLCELSTNEQVVVDTKDIADIGVWYG